MMSSTFRWVGGGWALLALGCVAMPAPGPSAVTKETVVSGASIVARVTVRGVVRSPADLGFTPGGAVIGNNGGTIISDNGLGIISNSGAGAWGGIGGAKVLITDTMGRAFKGVSPTSTDAEGNFAITGVPSGVNVVVEVIWPQGRLTGLVLPQIDMAPVAVTPASTVVTEHLRESFAEEPLALRRVPPAAMAALTEEVTQALDRGEVTLRLATRAQAAEVFAAVAARRPAVKTQGEQILTATREALNEAQQQGEPADAADLTEPAPTVAPTTAPTGTVPGGWSGPLPTVDPGVLPSPGWTLPSPTPTPSAPATSSPVPSPQVSMPSAIGMFSPAPFPTRSPLIP
jgi:hypothetical protein